MTGVIDRPRRRQEPNRIEPKLQRRRIEVARDQGRRRLRRFVVAGVVVFVVAGGVVLARSPLLDVDRIEVRGVSRPEAAAVRGASGITKGDALISVDLPATASSIEDLAWVDSAQVTRSWPDTVRISVIERVPVVVVGTGSAAVLVDRDGRAIAAATDRSPSALPALVGPPIRIGDVLAPKRRAAAAAVAELPADLRREVDRIRAAPSGSVLVLDDGIVVRWGDSSQQTAKSDALRVLLDKAGRATIASIDVTVPNAATVTRR